MKLINEITDTIGKIHIICSKNEIDFELNMDGKDSHIIMDELPIKKLTINIGNINDEGLIEILKEQLDELEKSFE
jgi:polysaccharide pyruvyl transferase WcaK-like protein